MLFWMSLVCVFNTGSSLYLVLNGVGRQHVVLRTQSSILLFRSYAHIFSYRYPSRIYGFVIGFCASAVLILLHLADLKRIPNINIDFANILLKPLFAFIGMFIIIKCCNLYLTAKAAESFNMTVSSIAGLIFFFLVLLLTGTFTPRQLKNTLFSHKSRVTGH